ncbi:MAG: hypothetical protein IJ523_09725 [Succinivibrionaceae bacterium]|nr:hypothetical protein [Succinivibrionaceae bacterium]
MKEVQEALKGVGIPSFAGKLKSANSSPKSPDAYLTHTTMAAEDEFWDDEARSIKTHVYLNLYTQKDPTDAAKKVRKAMKDYGFQMTEERFWTDTDDLWYEVSWTWIWREEI